MRCVGLTALAVRQERYWVTCGSRYCPACGARWAKDQRIRAVAAAKALPGECALITITGPGNDVFAPGPSPQQKTVRARKRAWNRSARERWTDLHRAASAGPRREAREAGSDWRLLYRTWEWQRRRVLHLHVVLPYHDDATRAATDAYVRQLWERARAHGFGFILGGDKGDTPGWDAPPKVKTMDVNATAAYVSKYVSKAGDSRNGMVSVARAAGMRGSVLYIAQPLLKASGVTMVTLQNRRRIWAKYPWARASRRTWQEATVVDAVQRGRAPLTPGAVAVIRDATTRGVPGRLSVGVREALVRPTRAPEPAGLSGHPPRRVLPGRVVSLSLASVLDRVYDGVDLGQLRTDVWGIVG
jgi:hypothetical protein